jgi:hypothetical protein
MHYIELLLKLMVKVQSPTAISKILIPFDTAWEDLDILKVFYVSDDMLSDTFLNSFLEDDGYIHVPV